MHEKEKTSRRTFLKKSSLTGVGLLTIPQLVSTAFAEEKRNKKVVISKDDISLFQGDSITDAGRKREKGWQQHKSAGERQSGDRCAQRPDHFKRRNG